MLNIDDFCDLKNLKKRIKDHLSHMENVTSQRQRTEIQIAVSNLENKISQLSKKINWGMYDFSECVFLDFNDRIQQIDEGAPTFSYVSHIWLVFDYKGGKIRIDLNRNDFNIDFLDKLKLINEQSQSI